MTFQKTLSKRTFKQHCLGSRIAIVINILWGISNYFIITENKWTYVAINFGASAIIIASMLFKKQLRFSGESLALVPMLSTVTAFAYTYNTVNLEVFQQMTYTYMAVFIGAGMFLLWHIKYSIISIVYALAINTVFFQLSPLTVQEYFGNGALAVVSLMLFMIISIQTRYKLVITNIRSTLALERSKNRLKESEEQHRLLFEQNPTAMIICSIETQNIIAVNDAIIEKYGYSRDEFIGMPLSQLYHDVDINDVLLYTKEAKQGVNRMREWIHVLKDKTEINVTSIAKTMNYKNKKVRLITLNDVTAVKKYEKELIEARHIAEESKELQSQFLSNMSHEIRTPMNGIIGITRILQNTEMSNDQKRYLNAILKSSENLMDIINDILDFSKIEAGKITLEKRRFELRELIDVVLGVLAVSAESKKVYLRVDIDDNVPDWIIGDSVRLNQILMNLISNGIKFTEKGGVTLKVESRGSKNGRDNIRFSVRDTGVGIPANKVGSIFESFTQASTSTTRKFGGTGLGLTISKQLTELQNGRIWVESEEGKGSTFTIEIAYESVHNTPVSTDKSNNSQTAISEATMLDALKGRKILLVEDHPINQMLALKVLRDWHIDVALAENGKIALEMIADTDYDLILMDISMPEMDGYTATEEIRSGKHTENKDIPIIAMTASAFIGENQKCFKSGMNDYITKPFDPSNLMEKIYDNLLSNHLKSA